MIWLLQLLLISFLHQTTTISNGSRINIHCFLSHFYIKPQLEKCFRGASYIASYLISTSNHNYQRCFSIRYTLLLISFLHQTTTWLVCHLIISDCFLSHFYIKPQLTTFAFIMPTDCFLSHFYIKPQRILYNPLIYKELGHVAHIRSG